MKRIIISLITVLMTFIPALAQSAKNNAADNIIGKYESVQGSDVYKVEVTKNSDGSYQAKLFYVKDTIDPKTGKHYLDTKNPDRSLRNVPNDQIVLIKDLKYNKDKKNWGDSKIYDPQRGIKVNVTAAFIADGRLSLKGSVLGIGETIYWTPIK